jgi:hypothetical protein
MGWWANLEVRAIQTAPVPKGLTSRQRYLSTILPPRNSVNSGLWHHICMYAESIVQQRLELASESLGFIPEYHSPSEIETFNAQLARKYGAEYTAAARAAQGVKEPQQAFQTLLLRLLCNPQDPKLNADEVRFMQNERAMVMSDAAYFMTRYYWILNDEGMLMQFKFRSGQKILFNVVAELESRKIAIEILLAKARQLGQSTVVAGLLLLKIMLTNGVTAVLASADSDKTRELAGKLLMAYDKIPWWLRTPYTKRAEGDKGYLKFGSIDSGLIFQHGAQTNPIAMGTTVVGYHLSEVSSYADAEDLIEVGLFKAVHPSPRIFGVLESTCKGDTGWWHDSYWDAKDGWAKGESRLLALFLPFYCAEDMYPNETERRAHPIPEGWQPEPETRQMMAESSMYVQSNPVLAHVLMQEGKQWQMRRDQAYYWEWNFKSAKRRGAEKSWYSEMPHTDQAAFQGSYDNVFGKPLIAEIFTQRETAYHCFGIIGQSIEERHEPDQRDVDWDPTMVRVPVKWASRRGEHYNWTLVPLAWQEPFLQLAEIRNDESHYGKFFVYHPPEPGFDYSMGIDTSNGIGRDGSCIAMSRRARGAQDQDLQVSEFRDNRISHVEAFAWGAAIAAYYSKYMNAEWGWTKPFRNPYISIEQVAAVGDTCQLQMRKMGFGRFHRMTRYDSKPQNMRKVDAIKEGWFTFSYTRAMLTDTFVILVQNGWYKINSPYTIWEADHWEVHYVASGKDKFEHSEDSTDDGLFANAMAAFCPNDQKSMADRTARQYRGDEDQQKPKLDMGPTQQITFSRNPSIVVPRRFDERRNPL